jgi:hypothetical protein
MARGPEPLVVIGVYALAEDAHEAPPGRRAEPAPVSRRAVR